MKASTMSTHSHSSQPRAYPGVTATARVLDNLALYGHRPEQGEPDPWLDLPTALPE